MNDTVLQQKDILVWKTICDYYDKSHEMPYRAELVKITGLVGVNIQRSTDRLKKYGAISKIGQNYQSMKILKRPSVDLLNRLGYNDDQRSLVENSSSESQNRQIPGEGQIDYTKTTPLDSESVRKKIERLQARKIVNHP